MANEVGQSVPGLQAQTAQLDYSVGAAPASSQMLQGSAEVQQQMDAPLESGVDKDAFDPDSKPDDSTKKCAKPKKEKPPLFPGVPKLDNLASPKGGGGRGHPPLKGGANTGRTNAPPLQGGTGKTQPTPPHKGGADTHPHPPIKGGTDATHPHPVPEVPKTDHVPNDPLKTGTNHTPETPKNTPKELPPGVKAITHKEWQEEKCRMLANLQRHMKGGADPVFDFRHWFLDTMAQGYTAAGTFDSQYWLKGADKQKYMFESGPMADRVLFGHEVNYYFQGMIAAAYGKTPEFLEDRIRSWKRDHHHTVPSPATLEMAKLGYDSYKQDIEDCKKSK